MASGIYLHYSHQGFQKNNKLGKLNIGKKWTKKRKEEFSKLKKGSISWNKGKKTGIIPKTIFKIGYTPWNKNKTGLYECSQKTREKLRQKSLGRKHTTEAKQKIREFFLGKSRPEMLGKNNPAWRDGVSFEPYMPNFNQQFKDKVRVKDNFICQICSIPVFTIKISFHMTFLTKRNQII